MIASALILAGGSGTRFWPASRRRRPKQFLALDAERTLLQETVDRLAPLVPPERVWISTTAELAAEVRRQLPEVAAERVLAEPCGRNTAPAIAWAVAKMPAATRAEPIAVLPSDHRIADPVAFREALSRALRGAAPEGSVVALGVVPRWAETGFGYLELADAPADALGLRPVLRFREKPALADAERFVASGRHLWNAGMFVFRGTTLAAHVERLAPELAAGLAAVAAAPEREAELYAGLPSVSIDVAIMEKLDGIATLPLDCGWNDLGSWQALFEVLEPDADGNRGRGSTFAVDARDNLLVAESGTIAVVGVEGLVVVRSGEAVLVLPRERAQDVRRIVERLAADGRTDLL